MPAPMSQNTEQVYGPDQLGDAADLEHQRNGAISSRSRIR